jgi:CheY-like chemotaxis protein
LADPAAQPLFSRRILVVDDQASIRGVLQVALMEAGAEVTCVADGPSALAALAGPEPELVLLDLVMPGMNGWEVLDAMIATGRARSIPVALQTSAEDFASFDRARRQGVAAFISKPFRLSEVIETCRRILGGARPLQGRSAEEPAPAARLLDDGGAVLGVGLLVDLAPHGAQVELGEPLRLGQRVILAVEGPESLRYPAEVRWITQNAVRYHHGLAIRTG